MTMQTAHTEEKFIILNTATNEFLREICFEDILWTRRLKFAEEFKALEALNLRETLLSMGWQVEVRKILKTIQLLNLGE